MTTSVAVTEGDSAQVELLIRAAVRITFDLSTFAGTDDPDALMDFLDARCERVRTPSGLTVWSLTDQARRQCLAQAPVDRLQAARAAAEDVKQSPLQSVLDRSLANGWTAAELAKLNPEEGRALSVVADWWDGRRAEVPTVERAGVLVGRLNLFADPRAMAADHFVGRSSVLRQLREHFQGLTTDPFAVIGLGGIGKSALIARHVVWAIDELPQPGAYAAVLDFDDPTLNCVYPLDIVHRIVSTVARQAEGKARQGLDRLATVALDNAETARYRGQTSSRATGGWQGGMVEDTISDLILRTERPILVVFDTVEQVQRRGSSAVASFIALLDQIATFGTRIRVLVAGRAEVPGLKAFTVELVGLDRPEAITLLTELCTRPVDGRTAAAVIDALGTSPLTIRLAARLISDSETVPGDLFTLDLHAERINAELYRRVLGHIRDLEVRKLAHPGLVLRRITPDILQRVLSRPCGVPVRDPSAADDLFARLAKEAMLVERSPDGASLTHRGDVRRVMLPQLLADRREVADRIQRSAVRYYAARDDETSKTEELYHRLMLAQKPATLAKHWNRKAADALVGALDEFPTVSRIYLSRRLPETYLSDDDRRLVDDAQWLDEVQPQVVRLLAAGDPEQAMHLLTERRTSTGSSMLPALEIEVLEALEDLPTAITLAQENRRTAAIVNDPDGVTTYTLHLARLLERSGEPTSAAAALEEALGAVRAPTVARLRLLVAMLGLWRRQGGQRNSTEYETLRAEAAQLHSTLGDRQIRTVPGLLRDLAADVSAAQPAILNSALGTIGVDASVDGLVPDALRELDDSIAVERGTSGLVADLAHIDMSDDEISWAGIATKPRGETGRALLEVLTSFGSSADPLRSAVTADYQHEADAALLGYRLNVAHKA